MVIALHDAAECALKDGDTKAWQALAAAAVYTMCKDEAWEALWARANEKTDKDVERDLAPTVLTLASLLEKVTH